MTSGSSLEAQAKIREAHRPYVRYLRGVAGLQQLCTEIQDGTRQYDPPLYDHQVDMLVTGAVHLSSAKPFAPEQGAYADIAGGGGKSRILVMLAEGLKLRETEEDPHHIYVISSDLETQAELAGLDGSSGFGQYTPHLDVGLLNGEIQEVDREVVIGTREATRRALVKDPTFLDRYDFVLSDESHTLLGERTSEVIRKVERPIFGVTGSPVYSSTGKRVTDVLPTRVMERRSLELTIDGTLSPIQHWVIKTGEVISASGRLKEYTPAELQHLASLTGRRLIAADLGIAFFRDNRNGAFACNTIKEATELAQALDGMVVTTPDGRERPIRVVPLLGDSDNNHEIIRQLDNDEIQAVTLVNIDTGWDAPRVSFLVNVRPTKSNVRAAQRRARSQRKYIDADGLQVTAQIVDLVDTIDARKLGLTEELQRYLIPEQAILAAQLMGETIYKPGLVIASPDSEGHRRDFDLDQFPPHLRWALTMADGVPLDRIHLFGAGIYREQGPDDKLTRLQAARGLGVTIGRLERILTLVSRGGEVEQYVSEAMMAKAEQYVIEHGEPIVL